MVVVNSVRLYDPDMINLRMECNNYVLKTFLRLSRMSITGLCPLSFLIKQGGADTGMRSWIKAQPEGEKHGGGTGTRMAEKEEPKLHEPPWRHDGYDDVDGDSVGEGERKVYVSKHDISLGTVPSRLVFITGHGGTATPTLAWRLAQMPAVTTTL
jgi:hypothetical protein